MGTVLGRDINEELNKLHKEKEQSAVKKLQKENIRQIVQDSERKEKERERIHTLIRKRGEWQYAECDSYSGVVKKGEMYLATEYKCYPYLNLYEDVAKEYDLSVTDCHI